MADTFYPFVEPGENEHASLDEVRYPARIAVYDDAAAAPRVLVVEPQDVRSYLEEITATVTKLAKEQGGGIPFMVIREIVENLIHAYFAEPAISILDGGDTIRFADQGPGITNKELALEYGTTSATNDMKRYIRGVGSGLPYAQQWLKDKGGSLKIEDNISRGTVVTITLLAETESSATAYLGDTLEESAAYAQAAPQFMTQPPIASMPAMAYGPVQAPMVAPMAYQQANPYYPAQMAAPVAPWPAQANMQAQQMTSMVSERGVMALGYLATHESVGPTELVAAFGHSQSTWTRELKALEDRGLVAKRGGQKRFLTPAGRAFMAR